MKKLANSSKGFVNRFSGLLGKKAGLIVKSTIIASTLISAAPASAVGAWYRGEIQRLYLFPKGFVMTFKSSALQNCKHNYVYFRNDVITQKAVDQALSLALSAQAQGKAVGVVFDMDINGIGGYCNGNGSIDMSD